MTMTYLTDDQFYFKSNEVSDGLPPWVNFQQASLRSNDTNGGAVFLQQQPAVSNGGGGGSNTWENQTTEPMEAATFRAADLSVTLLLAFLAGLTLTTILGNTLVILAVATTRRLRSVTNCFIVSLSVADLLVGCLVMPLSLVYEVLGVWPFGYILCELWSSLDIMLCTASILNLCCISLDRYFAITRPLTYTVKRNKRLAWCMIGVVWMASAAVTCPPLFGWYERQPDDSLDLQHVCQYVSDKGYVIYSACGSFFIPLTVMLFVYTRIFIVIYRRNKVVKLQKQQQQNSGSGTSHGHGEAGTSCRRGFHVHRAVPAGSGGPYLPFQCTVNGGSRVHRGAELSSRGELHLSNSDCLISLEMVSDSLLAIRPRCDSIPSKLPLECDKVGSSGNGQRGTSSGLYRSRSYQFQFHSSPLVTESTSLLHHQRKHSRVESHLLTVPHWSHPPPQHINLQHSPTSSSGALNASSTSARSVYTDSSYLYPPSDHSGNGSGTGSSSGGGHQGRAKMSLPALGLTPAGQNDLLRAVHHRSSGGTTIKDYRRRKHVRGLRMSFRKETKATTTIAVVVGGFIVCWMPFFVIYIVHPFCEQCAFSPLLVSGLTWLGWANSAVNPFIYAFYNMDFRAAFWRLTFGRCRKESVKGKTVVLYPQVWRSRLKNMGANGAVPSIVMVQSDIM